MADETQKITCCHEGCGNEALFIPKVHVPAQGYTLSNHQPLNVLLCMPACNEHVANVRVPDCLTPDLRRMFENASTRKGPPDYARAYITRCPVTHPAAQALLKFQKTHTTQPTAPAV